MGGRCVCAFGELGRKKAVPVIYYVSSLLPEKGTVRCQGMCSRVYLDLKLNLHHRVLIDWMALVERLVSSHQLVTLCTLPHWLSF